MGAPEATEPKSRNEYTVGWVYRRDGHARPKDPDLPNPPNDDNAYTLGTIGAHNIVIACLPQGKYGTNATATVAAHMVTMFSSIRLALEFHRNLARRCDRQLARFVHGTLRFQLQY
ncbi:hypothetical protein TOPH_02937 [Tolypocladium ophioglossoides CBS 100239]|uniref:Uncharacterized protein n=1 Tax=Tolypocladium ophioglossoides (strain CBS 100239) TaxID=1163406 RepID=A0A0L0NE15_TOLOC|nr:hypothetical protein TOPH_02937 [Tolypocladium ophioglossoides CBS 100239]